MLRIVQHEDSPEHREVTRSLFTLSLKSTGAVLEAVSARCPTRIACSTTLVHPELSHFLEHFRNVTSGLLHDEELRRISSTDPGDPGLTSNDKRGVAPARL